MATQDTKGEVEMKRLNVNISNQEYAALKEIADDCKVSVATILGEYVKDLTESDQSNGSDERLFARQYFDRTWVSWMNKEEF